VRIVRTPANPHDKEATVTEKTATKQKEGSGNNQRQPKVRWNSDQMSSSYANVCNVNSTREEVVLMFGTNERWSPEDEELTVRLSNRMIMSPFAAKRLHFLLGNIIQQYEQRFGALDTTAGDSGTATQN
jgi:uncharacterized protein DUF3467